MVFRQANRAFSPGCFPTIFTLTWKRQSRAAAIIAPIVGFAAGITAWVASAHSYYGEATITTLGQTLPCLWGNITSFFTPLPITLIISYSWPDKDFEWSKLLSIKRIEDDEHGKTGAKASHFDEAAYFTPERVAYMKRMARIAAYWAVATFVGQIALWPLPMYGARMIFSRNVRRP